MTEKDVINTIFNAIDDVNKMAPPEAQLTKNLSSILLGNGGVLDSLGLINLIVTIEEKIQDNFNIQAVILDEDALANPEGPFSTVGTLVEWVMKRLG